MKASPVKGVVGLFEGQQSGGLNEGGRLSVTLSRTLRHHTSSSRQRRTIGRLPIYRFCDFATPPTRNCRFAASDHPLFRPLPRGMAVLGRRSSIFVTPPTQNRNPPQPRQARQPRQTAKSDDADRASGPPFRARLQDDGRQPPSNYRIIQQGFRHKRP